MKRIIFIAFVLVATVSAYSQQRLLVIGGGERPPEAMKKFVEWSGGAKSRILVITWASGLPDEAFESLEKGFLAANAGLVEHAPVRPLDAEKHDRFIEQVIPQPVYFSRAATKTASWTCLPMKGF